MARTADPSAATKKAWLTRHRAQEGGHKEVVQQGGDFGRAGVMTRRADRSETSKLISMSHGNPIATLSEQDRANQRVAAGRVAEVSASQTTTGRGESMRWRDGEPLTTSANRPPSKPAPKPKLKRYINVDEEE